MHTKYTPLETELAEPGEIALVASPCSCSIGSDHDDKGNKRGDK